MVNDPIITVDDVIRAGACFDGVMKVVSRSPAKVAAAMPVSAVLKLISSNDEDYVLKAASLNGFGFGYGYGSGYGYGDGYGSGSGSGSGDGYGYGYGSGDGDGSGYGYGST